MSIFDDIGGALADVGRAAGDLLSNPVIDLAAGAVGGMMGMPQLGAGALAVGNILRGGGNVRAAGIQHRGRNRGALPRSFSTVGGILGRATGTVRRRGLYASFYPPLRRVPAPKRRLAGVPAALVPAPVPPPQPPPVPAYYRPPQPVPIYDDPAAHSLLATQLNIPLSAQQQEVASAAASANDGWANRRSLE